MILEGDLLGSQVFLHGQGEVGAALDCRVVGDNHAFDAMDPADAGHNPRAGHIVAVHLPCRLASDFKKMRVLVKQRLDAIAQHADAPAALFVGHRVVQRQGLVPGGRAVQARDQGFHEVGDVDAGTEPLELHGAHGYLLAQFLSAFTNRPPGQWAGDFDARSAFVRDVVRAVKQAVPEGFPIGFRLLVQEWVPEGIDRTEALALARVLEKMGIAYLSVSAGTYNSMFSRQALQVSRRPAYLQEDTRALRQAVNIPLILGGRVFRPRLARRVLEEGVADMVGLGRPLLADPGWLAKARAGKRVHVCVDCRHCLKRVIQEKGLACARWPEVEIERVDLECALHVRMNACLLFTTPSSLALSMAQLLARLPGPDDLAARIIYVIPPEEDGNAFQAAAEDHWKRIRDDWTKATGHVPEGVFPKAGPRTHDDIMAEARRDGYGMLVLVDGQDVPRGELLASKWREGVFLAMSRQESPGRKVFVAVDLSPATHILLRFISYGFPGRSGYRFRFVHVLEGAAQAARSRWEKMLPISGWDADTPLDLVAPGPDGVARTLLDAAAGWDTLVVGRRGLSRIKSLLLGSVSRRILREAVDANVVIVS